MERGKIKGLYAIVDGASCPAGSLPELARKFLKGGCRVIQLRMKSGRADLLGVAREIMKLKAEYDFTFIINDDADAALEAGADGVHVGEGDESVSAIRRRAGDGLIIGFSAHTAESAVRAEREGADYVGFGAVFPTVNKGPEYPVHGLDKLRALARAVKVPVVAIGGIGRQNVRDVIAAGARSVAMISALSQAKDVEAEVRWFVENIETETRERDR